MLQFGAWAAAHWQFWFLSVTLVVAAIIDGRQLKVPNWLTFSLIFSGWMFSFVDGGWAGLGWSLVGTAAGLGLLLPAYAIGGMGSGDVKLLAGIGAWVHTTDTFNAFCVSAIIGGLIAIGMAMWQRSFWKHFQQFKFILYEILTIRDPNQLAAIAAQRKSSMLLLPYGIPITIGTILYFAYMGKLV